MTREEAIEEIKLFKGHTFIKTEEAIDMAIKALEQNEQAAEWYKTFVEKFDSCEDCISRQAVYDLMRSLTRWCVRSEDGKFNNVGLLYDDVMFGINKLPSVYPQPKTGHWILADIQSEEDIDNDNYRYICSECQHSDIHCKDIEVPYCWNCGAKMEGEVKE